MASISGIRRWCTDVIDRALPNDDAMDPDAVDVVAELVARLGWSSDDVCLLLGGSRARGGSRPGSDYDLLLLAPRRLTFDEWSSVARDLGRRGASLFAVGTSAIGHPPTVWRMATEVANEPSCEFGSLGLWGSARDELLRALGALSPRAFYRLRHSDPARLGVLDSPRSGLRRCPKLGEYGLIDAQWVEVMAVARRVQGAATSAGPKDSFFRRYVAAWDEVWRTVGASDQVSDVMKRSDRLSAVRRECGRHIWVLEGKRSL